MQDKKKKIGIMGGTFDPIHVGHLILAENAWHQFGLEKILFMPSANPPHKLNRKGRACIEERVDMVQRAISGNPHFELSLEEAFRKEYCYTSETLRKMKKEHPDTEYYFIMGADSLYHIESWKDPEKILEMATIVVAGRAGTGTSLSSQIEYIENKYDATIYRLNSPVLEISSNDIRRRVRDGESIRYLLPSKVVDYIYGHNLYQPDPPEEVQKENE